MLIHKAALKAHAFASKDVSRPGLQGVRVFPDGRAVASDGHTLIEIHARTMPEVDFPAIEGLHGMTVPPEGVTIPASDCRAALKALPKRHDALPFLTETVMLGQNGNPDVVTLASTDLDRTTRTDARLIHGAFPDYEQVIPKNNAGGFVVAVNPALAARFFKTLADLIGASEGYCPRGVALTFQPGKSLAPIMAECRSDDATVRALLMPTRMPA